MRQEQNSSICISIHALREEGDDSAVHRTAFPAEFLSTPSARRATSGTPTSTSSLGFLSTPSARRATRGPADGARLVSISIHALREEGDQGSRPDRQAHAISIHALREEGDGKRAGQSSSLKNFYPRPPRGGRRRCSSRSSPPMNFYPRPPRGGRLTSGVCSCLCRQISIHALREEGDSNGGGQGKTVNDFYPRPPRGGRQVPASVQTIAALFLSTPSARRATAHSL